MDCSEAHELISSQLDGEITPREMQQLADHLGTCRACGERRVELTHLQRLVRVRAADQVPDLSAEILSRVRAPRRWALAGARLLLAAIATTEIANAARSVLQGLGTEMHEHHHSASLTIAVAVGLLFAAFRPARAAGLLPVVTTLAALNLLLSIVDIRAGMVATVAELRHIVDAFGLWLVWRLAGKPRPRIRSQAEVAYV